VTGVLNFRSGAVGTLITSFDVWESRFTRMIEIYGSEGTLAVPDPNGFGGPVLIYKRSSGEWREATLTHKHIENIRGIGVADMAYSLLSGKPHRANGEMAYHILEIMHGFYETSKQEKLYTLKSSCERPLPLPLKPMGEE
jgi:predicted dehydrogenase